MRLIEYLFFRPGPTGPVFDEWGTVLLGAYGALLGAVVLFYAVMRVLNARHGLKNRVARRILVTGTALQLLGLLLLGLRVADWPLLSMRILLYAQLAAELFAAGYLWWWLTNRYPERLAVYEWEDKKRAYLPRAAGGAVEPPRRRAAARRR